MRDIHIPLGMSLGASAALRELAAGAVEGQRMLTDIMMHTGKSEVEIGTAFSKTNLTFEQFYLVVMNEFGQGHDPLEWTNEQD